MTIGIMLFEGLSEPFTLVNSVAELWSQNITTSYHLKVEDEHKENLLIDFFKANNNEIIKAHIYVEHPKDKILLKQWDILICNHPELSDDIIYFPGNNVAAIDSQLCVPVRKEDITSSKFIIDFLNITRKSYFFSGMIDKCLDEIS